MLNICGGFCGCVCKADRYVAPGELFRTCKRNVCITKRDKFTAEMKEILEEKKEEHLGGHGLQRGKGHMVGLHAKTFSSRVKQPYLRGNSIIRRGGTTIKSTYKGKFNCEVRV